MEHQDTKLTSMRPRLKELNDNPYIDVRLVAHGQVHWLTL